MSAPWISGTGGGSTDSRMCSECGGGPIAHHGRWCDGTTILPQPLDRGHEADLIAAIEEAISFITGINTNKMATLAKLRAAIKKARS